MTLRHVLPLAATALLCACVTHIRPDRTFNPPPAEPLSHFQHFQLAPLQASADAHHESAALERIDANVRQKVIALVSTWESRDPDGRTLRIEPYVSQLKFVGVNGRFWVGPLAGSSAVVMKLRLVDATTGKTVGEPEFFQRASAMGGAVAVGGTDYGMLVRISTVCQQYLKRNYAAAVGGPTGLDGSED
ncbi:MAG: hypothetical protein ABFC67_10395 [Mizugakiibacter sp.]|uniref:hypothetical protein n=1 Tax=Mizugakiibacter sp. TaxID=1972610 RepID=UPI0031C99128|nr:hypothetical protein [Xanthomonadaceae bacterium]